MIETKRKAEIRRKAEDVNRISLDYHLTHVVFACNQLLKDAYKTDFQDPLRKLKSALEKAYRDKNEKEQKVLLEKKRHIEQTIKYYIYVEYVNMTAGAGRVIKTENQLVISLSKELLKQSRKDGSPVRESMEQLRRTTAHELGHAILHFKDIKLGTQGSKELDDAAEDEAILFAKELMRLRHESIENMYKSGVY